MVGLTLFPRLFWKEVQEHLFGEERMDQEEKITEDAMVTIITNYHEGGVVKTLASYFDSCVAQAAACTLPLT